MGIPKEINYWLSFLDEIDRFNGIERNEINVKEIQSIVEKHPNKHEIKLKNNQIVITPKSEPNLDAVIKMNNEIEVDSKNLWLYVETKYEQYMDYQKGYKL